MITASLQLLVTGSPASADQRRRHDVPVTVDVLPPVAQPGREPADPVRGAALVATHIDLGLPEAATLDLGDFRAGPGHRAERPAGFNEAFA